MDRDAIEDSILRVGSLDEEEIARLDLLLLLASEPSRRRRAAIMRKMERPPRIDLREQWRKEAK